MDDLTQDEIDEVAATDFDEFDGVYCRFLVNHMAGYLRQEASNVDRIAAEEFYHARQEYFKQIKRHLDESRKASDDAATRQGKIWGGQLLGWTTQKEIDALDKSIKTDY